MIPMIFNRPGIACVIGLTLIGLGPATKPSIPEQRSRWVEITHRAESAPLDPEVSNQAESTLKEIEQAHDIHVALCPALLSDLNGMQYAYAHVLTRQFMLASTLFMIENPAKADDNKRESRNAKNLAALNSVLKAYGSILQTNQNATSKTMDNLVQQQAKGKLSNYVSSRCP